MLAGQSISWIVLCVHTPVSHPKLKLVNSWFLSNTFSLALANWPPGATTSNSALMELPPKSHFRLEPNAQLLIDPSLNPAAHLVDLPGRSLLMVL